MILYKQLNETKNEEELKNFEANLADRLGKFRSRFSSCLMVFV